MDVTLDLTLCFLVNSIMRVVHEEEKYVQLRWIVLTKIKFSSSVNEKDALPHSWYHLRQSIYVNISNGSSIWSNVCQRESCLLFNSLTPGRCGRNFKIIIFKLIIQNSSTGIHCEIDHRTSLMRSQHSFRKWLGAVRQQINTWVNVDLPSSL